MVLGHPAFQVCLIQVQFCYPIRNNKQNLFNNKITPRKSELAWEEKVNCTQTLRFLKQRQVSYLKRQVIMKIRFAKLK